MHDSESRSTLPIRWPRRSYDAADAIIHKDAEFYLAVYVFITSPFKIKLHEGPTQKKQQQKKETVAHIPRAS